MVKLVHILHVQLQALAGPQRLHGAGWWTAAEPLGLSSAPHCQGMCVRLIGHLLVIFSTVLKKI